MRAEVERLALAVQLASFPGTTLPPEWERLLGEGLGGICLFGSNTASGGAAALSAAIRAVSPNAVIATDEEGGDVTRLYYDAGSPFLGAAALGAADDLELTRATAAMIGTALADCGIDLDLGPVADVNSNPDNPVIGARSFGADPSQVAKHVVAWVDGLQSAGVAACLKHFPGHGDTGTDSHLALPRIESSLEVLDGRELVPFAAAAAGAASVMTSHIVVDALDADLPATLSPHVLAHLRDALGFDGVIVSDALDMAGASAVRGIPEAAVLSLIAGADLLCIGADKDEALVRSVQAAIVEAVASGRLDEVRLSEAVRRVEAMPRGGGRASPYDLEVQVDGARAALRIEGDLPDLTGALLVRVETEPNIAVGVVPWGLPGPVVAPGFTTDRPVVVQARDAHRHPATLSLLVELAARGPVVLVDYGWPAPLPVAVPRVVTHGGSQPSNAVVDELLRARGWRP